MARRGDNLFLSLPPLHFLLISPTDPEIPPKIRILKRNKIPSGKLLKSAKYPTQREFGCDGKKVDLLQRGDVKLVGTV
jgi:hypothetical protein